MKISIVGAGNVGGALGAAGSTFVGPPTVGKLLSSQPFVRWLSGTGSVNPASTGSWGEYLGRLAGVAKADPSIANEVAALRQKLQPQPTGAPNGDTSYSAD